jgi:hypothetical protein
MEDQLSFDVYANISDPRCRVEHDAHDRRVSVTIGGSTRETPVNLLQLWFKEPATLAKLGQELISAGRKLDAQQTTVRSETEQSGTRAGGGSDRLSDKG